MLTQVTEVDSRIRALKEGADDYIDKPFSAGELLARIEAVLRRTCSDPAGRQEARWLCCGKLRVDRRFHRVYRGKRELPLSPKEVGILEHLMRHAGEVIGFDALVDVVWGPGEIVGPGSLYRCMSKLRKALSDDATQPRLIQTVAGEGYCFIAPVEVLP
jgi:DNA-binding response OmpR family regulator